VAGCSADPRGPPDCDAGGTLTEPEEIGMAVGAPSRMDSFESFFDDTFATMKRLAYLLGAGTVETTISRGLTTLRRKGFH
jgi:hypothetical protein